MQGKLITQPADLTIDIVAPVAVVDPVAVANSEASLGAVPPNRVLDEPREDGREGRVESAGVDPTRDAADDVSAATLPIAAHSI